MLRSKKTKKKKLLTDCLFSFTVVELVDEAILLLLKKTANQNLEKKDQQNLAKMYEKKKKMLKVFFRSVTNFSF